MVSGQGKGWKVAAHLRARREAVRCRPHKAARRAEREQVARRVPGQG